MRNFHNRKLCPIKIKVSKREKKNIERSKKKMCKQNKYNNPKDVLLE